MPDSLSRSQVIDHLNGIGQATEFIRNAEEVAISAITRAEVLTGVTTRRFALVARLLDQFRFLPIEKETADLAASLRKEKQWKLPDALQAALALQHSLVLATRNTKDFNLNRDRFVEIPYVL